MKTAEKDWLDRGFARKNSCDYEYPGIDWFSFWIPEDDGFIRTEINGEYTVSDSLPDTIESLDKLTDHMKSMKLFFEFINAE